MLDFLESYLVKIDPILLGNYLGRTALILFVLVLQPGIFRRMGWVTSKNIFTKIVQYISRYRPQVGVCVYLFAVAHFMFVRIFPNWPNGLTLPYALFELFGLTSLILLTPLFLTANKFSYRLLGKKWKKLHRLVYVIVWLLFIHVALVGTWYLTYLILFTAILEVISFINDRHRRNQKA